MSLQDQFKVEEVGAMYFNEDAIRLPNYRLYRFGSGDFRTYYEFVEDEGPDMSAIIRPKFYIGVTSLIRNTLPTPPSLINWMLDMGKEESKKYATERAEYGTAMHCLIAKLLIDRKVDLDSIPLILAGDGLVCEDAWVEDLRKDVLGFAQFMIDYDVKPLVIEASLRSLKMGVSGTLDLFCTMSVPQKGFWGETYASGPRKGEPKETTQNVTVHAIVDFKSSRKGVHTEHEIQLKFYERFIRENFEAFAGLDINIYNWRPKDWRKSPDYVLTDQTGKHSDDYIDTLVKLYYSQNELYGKEKLLTGGTIVVDNGIAANYSTVGLEDLLLKKHGIDNGQEQP